MNYLIKLAFLGKNYHGWQMQDIIYPTVERTVLEALQKLWSNVENVQGCSRTDAGVNANGYIANFKTDFNLPTDKVPVALNSVLPADIRCLECEVANENFSARFASKGKKYVYTIDTSEIQSPISSFFSWHCPQKLNINRMRKAAKMLIGEMDYSSFCGSSDIRESKIRTINKIEIKKRKNLIEISIFGNAFLYNMCRIIAGFLVHYGKNEYNEKEINKIINAKLRSANPAATLPAHGLSLEKVYY